ncbi:hypothetical protein SSCG_05240 [Streptomyces clavuligerus]|nr:hypothetical protein SSCG_05240 [Streptomyces clavuligerus]
MAGIVRSWSVGTPAGAAVSGSPGRGGGRPRFRQVQEVRALVASSRCRRAEEEPIRAAGR